MTTVSESIRSLMTTMTRIYESSIWKTCPICHEEWTKLMQVYFYKKDVFDKWRRCELYCCPDCSRSVKSAEWISERFGVGFEVGDIKILDAFRNIEFPKDHNPTYAFFMQLPNARIVPRAMGVEVHCEGLPKEFFPNIACAMSFLVHGKKETLESTDWT